VARTETLRQLGDHTGRACELRELLLARHRREEQCGASLGGELGIHPRERRAGLLRMREARAAQRCDE
jgi:hypothetical protein